MQWVQPCNTRFRLLNRTRLRGLLYFYPSIFMARLIRTFSLFATLVCICYIANAQQIGTWQDHLSYRNGVDVTVGDNAIITSAEKALFYYSLEDYSITKLSKANGLSDISDVSAANEQKIEYSQERGILLVGYTNGNIDLVEEGKVYNISNFKDALIVGAKRINAIYFSGDYAYLSTTLGVMVIDLVKRQIKDTYKVGPTGDAEEVFATTTLGDTIYAATEFGVYKAPNDGSVNLLNFAVWHLLGPAEGLPADKAQNLITFNGKVIAQIDDELYMEEGKQWQKFYGGGDWNILDLTNCSTNLITTEVINLSGSQVPDSLRIGRMKPDLTIDYPVDPKVPSVPMTTVESANGDLWIADFYQGLIKYTPTGYASIYPNGPATSNIYDMDAANGRLYVAPGGINASLNYLFNRDGYFTLNEEGYWNTNNEYTVPELANQIDNIVVEVDDQTGIAYLGSYYNGVLKINGSEYTVFNHQNSSLQGPSGDSARTTVAGLAIDNEGNLWVGNNNVSRPLTVIRPDGSSRSFAFPNSIGQAGELVIDQFDQKWIITLRNSTIGLVVFNHGADINNTSDDQYFVMRKGQGQGNLHNADVNAVAVDKDGEIWVGTNEGITVFYCPGQLFTSGCDATRILVEENGEYHYLLEAEVITCITMDGANRKWIGTNNGAFLMSPDGTKQIEYFNVDNSPLLSNGIFDIAINDQTGEVFFGTDKGIISYVGTATESASTGDCKVYPNPVREDYKGPITIDNVPMNADVKITDANGVKVFETTSLGSRVIWDGNNYNGQRAQTGVYLIFISNSDGTETAVCRLLLVN